MRHSPAFSSFQSSLTPAAAKTAPVYPPQHAATTNQDKDRQQENIDCRQFLHTALAGAAGALFSENDLAKKREKPYHDGLVLVKMED